MPGRAVGGRNLIADSQKSVTLVFVSEFPSSQSRIEGVPDKMNLRLSDDGDDSRGLVVAGEGNNGDDVAGLDVGWGGRGRRGFERG